MTFNIFLADTAVLASAFHIASFKAMLGKLLSDGGTGLPGTSRRVIAG